MSTFILILGILALMFGFAWFVGAFIRAGYKSEEE